MSPERVVQSQGELVLTVEATGLVDSGDELKCRLVPQGPDGESAFASEHLAWASRIMYEAAVAPDKIECTFGLVPPGVYVLGLAINRVQWVSADASPTRVLSAMQILDVEPVAVLRHSPGQVIFVQAENLVPGCMCIFESMNPANAPFQESSHAVEASRLGNQLLACNVPDLIGAGVAQLSLRLSLNEDLRTRSQSSFLLRVTDQCPPGHACLNGEVIECPQGHQCPGGLLEQPPRRCPIGSFQDEPGAATCRTCPRGAICPFPGMEEPLACPPGFSCDSQGLSSPASECPEGHYCLAGTEGDEPFLNGLFDNFSHLCTPGAYCRPGMRTGVVLLHANTSAPAPCSHGSVCSEGSAAVGGLGPCPAGAFCPTPRHSGVPCPPRHYCPGRGNPAPIKCPRGTFNMHIGQ